MKRTLLAGIVAAVLTLSGVGAAQPTPAAAATCDGVWVIIDYGSLGGVDTACATSHGTGLDALKSAGLTPTLNDGMLTRIGGKPAKPDLDKSYWSYWQAAQKADGSHGAWKYSNLGASASHPKKGDAEGWHYVDLSDAASGPGVAPPDSPVVKPTPKPTPTSAKPKPSPTSAKPKPSPTKSVSATTSPTPTKSATTSAPATESASASPSAPTASASATPDMSAWPTPSSNPSDPTALATPYVAEPAPPTSGDPDGNSPVGMIAAMVVLVAGGGGLGLWWHLRGRTR